MSNPYSLGLPSTILCVIIAGAVPSLAQQAEVKQQYKRASLSEPQPAESGHPVQRASLKNIVEPKQPFRRHELEFQYIPELHGAEDRDYRLFAVSYMHNVTPSIRLGVGYDSFMASAMKSDPPGGGYWIYPKGYSCPVYSGLLSVSFFPDSMFDPRITLGIGYISAINGGPADETLGFEAVWRVDLKYHATENLFLAVGVKGHSGLAGGYAGYGVSTGYSFGTKK